MMEITGYKYLYHKIKIRPWGPELSFGVNKDGRDINDSFQIDDPKADEKELQKLIEIRLSQIDIVRDTEVIEKTYTEAEVTSLLVEKGYLTAEQTLDELATQDDLLKVAK